jgi:hypothetical protein
MEHRARGRSQKAAAYAKTPRVTARDKTARQDGKAGKSEVRDQRSEGTEHGAKGTEYWLSGQLVKL